MIIFVKVMDLSLINILISLLKKFGKKKKLQLLYLQQPQEFPIKAKICFPMLIILKLKSYYILLRFKYNRVWKNLVLEELEKPEYDVKSEYLEMILQVLVNFIYVYY